MGLLVLLAAGTLAYLHFTGQLNARAWRMIAAGAAGLLAIELLATGRMLPGLVVAACAIGFAFWNKSSGRAVRMTEEEAREVLGVSAVATPDEIRAAYRRIIAQVHPDKGGSPYLSHRVNAARDILLKSANKRPRGAS